MSTMFTNFTYNFLNKVLPGKYTGRLVLLTLCVSLTFLVFSRKKLVIFDVLKPTVKPCGIWAPTSRNQIFEILQECGLKTGVELGVWRGDFSEHMLKNWKSCTKYYVVDPWLIQKNYKDWLNLNNSTQSKLYEETKTRLKKWQEKTVFLRHTTREAAPKFADNSIDFIYIDARHDYCATKEDIELYWPKVRPGGILSGHDYKWTGDAGQAKREGGLDWGICENGQRHEGAVKRAVDEFVAKNKLNLTLTKETLVNPSWILAKS